MINGTLYYFQQLLNPGILSTHKKNRLGGKIIYGLTNVTRAKTILKVICSCHVKNYANESCRTLTSVNNIINFHNSISRSIQHSRLFRQDFANPIWADFPKTIMSL